jgi:hypothetical protein
MSGSRNRSVMRILSNARSVRAQMGLVRALSPQISMSQRALSVFTQTPTRLSGAVSRHTNAFPTLSLCRHMSENTMSDSSSPQQTFSPQTSSDNVLGQAYHDLVYRGRGGLPLSLGDLRSLFLLCISESSRFTPADKEKAKKCRNYILFSTHLYQTKGQDFSEEINSLFIKAMLSSTSSIDEMHKETIVMIMSLFEKYKNRLGSWSTAKSTHTLITAFEECNLSFSSTSKASSVDEEESHEDGDDEEEKDDGVNVLLLVSMLDVISTKGVYLSAETLTIVTKLIDQMRDDISATPEGAIEPEGADDVEGEAEPVDYVSPRKLSTKESCLEKMNRITTRIAKMA